MQFTTMILSLFAATALAAPSASLEARQEVAEVFARAVVNSGRPVANGACCIADTNKKGDVCTNAKGAKGVCAVANTAGCNAALTCV